MTARMRKGDILPGLGVLMIVVGVLTGAIGVAVAWNSSNTVEIEGEIIDKVTFSGGRKDIVVRLDDGSIERETWADDDLWYNYEVGDRMPIEIFVEDIEQRNHGLHAMVLGAITALVGYTFVMIADGRVYR